MIGMAVSFMLGLPLAAFAATTPSLGAAATYGVLGSTYTNGSVTTINGDVGFTTGPSVAPLGTHTNYGSGAPYATAGIDQGAALSTLNALPCNFTFGSATDLSLLTQPLTAGVYCVTGAQSVGTGGITLGAGTYVFRSTGALNTVANSHVTGGSACDVFWTPGGATTLGANSTFTGTDIDAAGITVGANVTWTGLALAFGGTVTTDTDTITAPSCGAPPPPPAPIYGCMDSTATNYNASATSQTGVTCTYPVIPVVQPVIATTTTTTTATTTVVTAPVTTTTTTVVTPSLPNTGFPPQGEHTSWFTVILLLLRDLRFF